MKRSWKYSDFGLGNCPGAAAAQKACPPNSIINVTTGQCVPVAAGTAGLGGACFTGACPGAPLPDMSAQSCAACAPAGTQQALSWQASTAGLGICPYVIAAQKTCDTLSPGSVFNDKTGQCVPAAGVAGLGRGGGGGGRGGGRGFGPAGFQTGPTAYNAYDTSAPLQCAGACVNGLCASTYGTWIQCVTG